MAPQPRWPAAASGVEVDAAGPAHPAREDAPTSLSIFRRCSTRVRQTGHMVEDVEVRGPSLQSVFIHLTGRELRE